jgi:quinol monooxygenase YgiN
MRTVSLVHHRVADFDAWKEVYDSFRETQREGGVREQAVLRSPDDPNSVVVVHTFDDAASAKTFFENPALRDAMGRGGVDESSLKIEFLHEVDAGEV